MHTTTANELDVAGEDRLYRALRHFWHPVAYSADVAEDPVPFTLLGEDIVVARLGGEAVAMRDLCAHRGTRLSLGKVVNGDRLQCPYHGWQYDGTGLCRLAPQRPDLAERLKARIRRYPTQERYGLVWVCLVDEPEANLPDYPAWDDPTFHHAAIPAVDWNASAPRRVENYTDYSHLHLVHHGWLGDREQPEVPAHDVWRDGNRLECKQDEHSWVRVPVESDAWDDQSGDRQYIYFRSDWRIFMPLTVVLDTVFTDGRQRLLFHPTPMGPKRHRNFTIASRDFGDPAKAQEEMGFFTRVVYEQDQPVVESQRPEELPEDLSEEMHLKGVDTFSVEYRRWLVELSKSLVADA